ncbi:MAG: hypothetical protein ACKVP7_22605 [Hyphomicrobiaceae bacterium]
MANSRSLELLNPDWTSAEILDAKAKGRLPAMVDWLDPPVLVAAAIRQTYAATIGTYADTRPQQALGDFAGDGDPEPVRPFTSPANAAGETWVDFVADLGDGFDATYAIAHLIAQPSLSIKGVPHDLPAGPTLMMGGDLAYPDATPENYNDRCLAPYAWAYPATNPRRQVLCLAGNHDWHDGLGAFTDTFLTPPRQHQGPAAPKHFGGWTVNQRRSYFALEAPGGWQVWAIDLGMTRTIDHTQLQYFETCARGLSAGCRVLLIIHEPLWVSHDTHPLDKILAILEERKLLLRGIVAGDLHHYSHYTLPHNGIELITSGGGGAFMHGTHDLPTGTTVAARSGNLTRIAEPAAAAAAPAAPAAPRAAIAGATYPSYGTSAALMWRHLRLRGASLWFALALAGFYLLIGWFHQQLTRELNNGTTVEQTRQSYLAAKSAVEALEKAGPPTAGTEGMLAFLRSHRDQLHKQYVEQDRWLNICFKAYGDFNNVKDYRFAEDFRSDNMEQFTALRAKYANDPLALCMVNDRKYFDQSVLHSLMDVGPRTWRYFRSEVRPSMVAPGVDRNPVSVMFSGLIAMLLILYVRFGIEPMRLAKMAAWKVVAICLPIGVVHLVIHYSAAVFLDAFAQELANVVESVLSTLGYGEASTVVMLAKLSCHLVVHVALAATIASVILSLYWIAMSRLLGWHQEAISSLQIADYKNFLRLRFDAVGRLTIFVIGLPKTPRNWVAAPAGSVSKLVARKPLRPVLVETIELR